MPPLERLAWKMAGGVVQWLGQNVGFGRNVRTTRWMAAWSLTLAVGILSLPHDHDATLDRRRVPSAGGGADHNATKIKKEEPSGHVLPPGCDEKYKAVEIGTSNFNTLIQAADPRDTGLSVDAMRVYIDQLPERKCWRKLNTAVVGHPHEIPKGGLLKVYYVDNADIEKHSLPWWLRGCNSVDRPHPTGAKFLREKGLSHLMRNNSVGVVSVGQLLDDREICRMGTFKVDVEGLDGDLLVAYSLWVEGWNGTCYADEVVGEFNELSMGTGPDLTDFALARVGYTRVSTLSAEDQKWRYQR